MGPVSFIAERSAQQKPPRRTAAYRPGASVEVGDPTAVRQGLEILDACVAAHGSSLQLQLVSTPL
jgi:hypothetical protein